MSLEYVPDTDPAPAMDPPLCGYLPDPAGAPCGATAASLFGGVPQPEAVDLSSAVVEVLWQPWESCVAYALAQAIRMCAVLMGLTETGLPDPEWIYWWARYLAGQTDRDMGSYPYLAMEAIERYGYPWQGQSPPPPDAYTAPPLSDARAAITQAAKVERHPIFSASEMRSSLAAKQPCVMGITIDQAFIDWADALADGTAWELSGASKGRHMVCVVGYDRFGAIIVNSWGKGRHAGGFIRVSWQTVTDATDRYAITAVPRLLEIQR